MIIPQSQAILLHRLSILEGETLPAAHALVAKYRGEILNREAIEKLEAPEEGTQPVSEAVVDRRV